MSVASFLEEGLKMDYFSTIPNETIFMVAKMVFHTKYTSLFSVSSLFYTIRKAIDPLFTHYCCLLRDSYRNDNIVTQDDEWYSLWIASSSTSLPLPYKGDVRATFSLLQSKKHLFVHNEAYEKHAFSFMLNLLKNENLLVEAIQNDYLRSIFYSRRYLTLALDRNYEDALWTADQSISILDGLRQSKSFILQLFEINCEEQRAFKIVVMWLAFGKKYGLHMKQIFVNYLNRMSATIRGLKKDEEITEKFTSLRDFLISLWKYEFIYFTENSFMDFLDPTTQNFIEKIITLKRKTVAMTADRFMSSALRHKAIDFGLKVLPEGFVRVSDLLKLKGMQNSTLEDVKVIVERDMKGRFTLASIEGEFYVRANQGHSGRVAACLNDDTMLKKITVPCDAFHGTTAKNWAIIAVEGLKCMNRKHIHFAKAATSKAGIRYGSQVLVKVDMEKAMKDNMLFYESDNSVILTTGFHGTIPPMYLSLLNIDRK